MPFAFRDEESPSGVRSTIVCTSTLWTSTIGASPVTVTVSSSADTQLGVDRRHEVPSARSPRASRSESRQRERQGVGAGAKIDDSIPAGAVGHDGANLFNKCRARGFDRHAGQHCAGPVLDHTGNRALSERRRRNQQDHRQGRTQSLDEMYTSRFS